MKNLFFLFLMVSLKLSSQDINYNVNSHYYKNEMNPHFDLIEIVENHGIEGPKYGGYYTDQYAMPREKPSHKVKVDGFFIDITEVTNRQFKAFVDATGYLTIAEREIDWEDMKKQLPADTPKPHDSILQPGSLIFNKKVNVIVNM